MILDSNRLIASVYDTIQVWDLSTYQMTNLLNPKSLDSPGAATTCFAVLRDRLVKCQQIARTLTCCLNPKIRWWSSFEILIRTTRKVCGTQNGQLKLIDLESGKVVSTSSKNHNYVSDVCVKVSSYKGAQWETFLHSGWFCGRSWLVWWSVKVAVHRSRPS